MCECICVFFQAVNYRKGMTNIGDRNKCHWSTTSGNMTSELFLLQTQRNAEKYKKKIIYSLEIPRPQKQRENSFKSISWQHDNLGNSIEKKEGLTGSSWGVNVHM